MKKAKINFLIDPNLWARFAQSCKSQDQNASQVIRRLIRDYLIKEHD